MSDVFYVRDVLGTLASVREIMRARALKIREAGGDPNVTEDQLARLKDQESKRATDEEAHPMDDDFMHAIDVGMPPTGGVGLGVERIVMILTDRASIRDIILFPTMKLK